MAAALGGWPSKVIARNLTERERQVTELDGLRRRAGWIQLWTLLAGFAMALIIVRSSLQAVLDPLVRCTRRWNGWAPVICATVSTSSARTNSDEWEPASTTRCQDSRALPVAPGHFDPGGFPVHGTQCDGCGDEPRHRRDSAVLRDPAPGLGIDGFRHDLVRRFNPAGGG